MVLPRIVVERKPNRASVNNIWNQIRVMEPNRIYVNNIRITFVLWNSPLGITID